MPKNKQPIVLTTGVHPVYNVLLELNKEETVWQ